MVNKGPKQNVIPKTQKKGKNVTAIKTAAKKAADKAVDENSKILSKKQPKEVDSEVNDADSLKAQKAKKYKPVKSKDEVSPVILEAEALPEKIDVTNTSEDVLNSAKERAEKIIKDAKQKTDELINGKENVVDDANVSKDVNKVSVDETVVMAGLILNSSFDYYQTNANEITQNPELHEFWQSTIKSLAGDAYADMKGAGNGDLKIFKAVVDSFNNAEYEEQKATFVSVHPEIFEQLLPLINSESAQKAAVAGTAALAAEATAQETDSGDGSGDSGDGGDAGSVAQAAGNGNGKKQGFIRRHVAKLVLGTLLAASVGGWFGYQNYTADSGRTKTEQIQTTKKTTDEVKEESGITPSSNSISGANSSTSFISGASKTFTYTGSINALGFPKMQNSDITTNAASVQEVEKKLEQAKTAKKDVAKTSGVSYTCEGNTYVYDLDNPANAKLANKLGISGFVQHALKETGNYTGINAEFMKLVKANCELNGVGSIWHKSDVGNKVVISLDGANETGSTNSTNIRPTEVTVNINCEQMLDQLGVDSTERQNLKYENGVHVIDYKMIDSLKPLNDCVFMADLKECRLIVEMPDSSSFMFEGGAIIRSEDPPITPPIKPIVTPIDTIPAIKTTSDSEKVKTDTLKQGGVQQIFDINKDKDKSESILKKSFRHKR